DKVRKYKHKSIQADKMSKRLRVEYIELNQDNLDKDQKKGDKEPEDNNEYINNDE
ncbi:14669_t:CDS:2, partial [Cetraspora pellucida]